jgi:myo-inositol-1(or 4)-monophosphatase
MEQYNNPDNSAERRMESMRTAVLEAGAYILQSEEREHTDKSNKKDFVTVADIKAQDMLRQALRRENPNAAVLSEEDTEEERQRLFDPNFTGFVLDPIDGTYNFKRDLRESAISAGYVENGKIIQGVVFDPFKDELFTAELGKGAFRNGEPILVRQDYDGLDGASIATSNSYNGEAMRRNLDRQDAIYDKTGIMPWLSLHGSGVLIMTNIACGRFDAYHHNGLKPWDNAAAFLIVREAGGVVQTLAGGEAPFTSPTVLMGVPGAVADLRNIFSQLDPELLT